MIIKLIKTILLICSISLLTNCSSEQLTYAALQKQLSKISDDTRYTDNKRRV